MAKSFLSHFFRFIGLVLFQVLVFDHINLFGLINPMVYPAFILLLPFRIAKWQLLLLGFVIGITIDLFSGTHGMNAAATVFMAYLRPYIVGVISTSKFDLETTPDLNEQGLNWILIYFSAALLLHHAVYFIIQIGSFADPINTGGRILLSTVISVLLIILIELIFGNQKKSRLS